PRASQIPVICLTGKTETASKVAAFTLGVEDYIVKPFDTIELRVRVEAKLKKIQRARNKSDHLVVGRLQIDRDNYTVHVTEASSRREISLTPTEFKLLCHLARQPERVFSREQLMTAVWGNDAEVFDRAVDVHMSGVRRKLGELGEYLQ